MKFYRWLFLLLALEAVLISVPGSGARSAQGEKTPTLAAAVESIISLTNQFRKEQGRQEVKAGPELTATAKLVSAATIYPNPWSMPSKRFDRAMAGWAEKRPGSTR